MIDRGIWVTWHSCEHSFHSAGFWNNEKLHYRRGTPRRALSFEDDLEGDSRSSDYLYSIGHIYYFPVTTTPSGTVSEILPHLQCTWLAVTLGSPLFSKRLLQLEATCAFRFICKHIVNITRCIVRKKGLKQQNWQKWPSRSLEVTGNSAIRQATRFSISLPLQLCLYFAPFQIYYLISQNLNSSLDPEHIPHIEGNLSYIHALVLLCINQHTTFEVPKYNKNTSGDEIANVNFLRRYGTYVLQNTKKENLLRLTY